MPRTLTLLAGLTAIAVSLAGCQARRPTPSPLRTFAPVATPTPLLVHGIDAVTVTSTNLAHVIASVRTSSLPRTDKNAFLAFAHANAAQPSMLDGKNVRTIVNEELIYEAGLRMVSRARAQDAEHRAEMAEIVDASIPMWIDRDHAIDLHVRVHNKVAKTIAAIDAGLIVYDQTQRRIGLAEIDFERHVPPGGTVVFPYPMPYVRFGEATGSMRLAAGHAKHLVLEIKTVRYTDGSREGEDD